MLRIGGTGKACALGRLVDADLGWMVEATQGEGIAKDRTAVEDFETL